MTKNFRIDKTGRKPRVLVEITAGGIVYKRTPRGPRIALIMDPYGKWTFAKGHVEKGESVEHAAVRETEEEMGLKSLRVIAPLGKLDIWFRDRYRPATRGSLIHKFIYYFLMEAPPGAKGKPQRKEKIRTIIWVSPQCALEISDYKDVRPILSKAVLYFERGKRKVVE